MKNSIESQVGSVPITRSEHIEWPDSKSAYESLQNHSAGDRNGLTRFATTMNIATITPISASPAIIPADSNNPRLETFVACSVASALGSPVNVPSIRRWTVRNTK